MQAYSFAIALRFWHPSADPQAITDRLNISPLHTARAGEPRFTPKGTPLEGTHRESYWHAEPLGEGWRDSETIDAETALLDLLSYVAPHGEFIRGLVSSGGRALVHISSHGPGNYAIEIPASTLSQCSDIGLSIAHEVYAVEQA